MFMKLYLTSLLLLFLSFFSVTSYADNFKVEYTVSTTGVKIGYFTWSLDVYNNTYKTEINLKNSGFLSPIYKFSGNYLSDGIIEKNTFKSKKYEQVWKTKNKTKVVSMSFNDFLTELVQDPKEKELPRLELEELYLYFDPITSFLNILNGKDEAKTVDGRRIYTLKKNSAEEDGKIVLKIEDYQNIWSDHKRNDLKKIEFFIKDDFLPYKIYVHFKKRIFSLEKI